MKELIDQAKSYYEQKMYQKALDIYEEIKDAYYEEYHQSSYIHLWCLYRLRIDNEVYLSSHPLEVVLEDLNYILDHGKQGDLLIQVSLFKMIKYIMSKGNGDARLVLQLLDKVNPEDLKKEVYTCCTPSGTQIVCPSYQEKWYSLKTKCLHKLGLHQECIELSQKAMEVIPEFHCNNDIWIGHRMGLSHFQLGNHKEALKVIGQLLLRKKEWFFYADIGRIYYEIEDYAKALENYYAAVSIEAVDAMKINLFLELSKLHKVLNQEVESELYHQYRIKLLDSNGWGYKEEDTLYASIHKAAIDTHDNAYYKKKIKAYCNQYRWQNRQQQKGIIANILGNGKAGFIHSGKHQYYFKINSVMTKEVLKVDDSVTFYTEPSYDMKKKKETVVAVEVRKEAMV